jgi:hypothetical protein
MEPGSIFDISTSTGAPIAIALALGFQLETNGTVASTTPTVPVTVVATVKK